MDFDPLTVLLPSCNIMPCNIWQAGWKAGIDVQIEKACFQLGSLLNLFLQLVLHCVKSQCLNLVYVRVHQSLLAMLLSWRSMIQDMMDHQEVLCSFLAKCCNFIAMCGCCHDMLSVISLSVCLWCICIVTRWLKLRSRGFYIKVV